MLESASAALISDSIAISLLTTVGIPQPLKSFGSEPPETAPIGMSFGNSTSDVAKTHAR